MTAAVAATSFHVKPSLPLIRPEPLFDSVHQALLFAYTFTPNQHPASAVVERTLMEMGRERYERLRYVSRGLGGLDGAAQAGMIKRHVEALPSVARAVTEARFAVLDTKVRNAAMRLLVLRMRCDAGGVPIDALSWAVQRYFGICTLTVPVISDRIGVPVRTLERRWQDTRRSLDDHHAVAMSRLSMALGGSGVINAAFA